LRSLGTLPNGLIPGFREVGSPNHTELQGWEGRRPSELSARARGGGFPGPAAPQFEFWRRNVRYSFWKIPGWPRCAPQAVGVDFVEINRRIDATIGAATERLVLQE
jgi:hypothetical protein